MHASISHLVQKAQQRRSKSWASSILCHQRSTHSPAGMAGAGEGLTMRLNIRTLL